MSTSASIIYACIYIYARKSSSPLFRIPKKIPHCCPLRLVRFAKMEQKLESPMQLIEDIPDRRLGSLIRFTVSFLRPNTKS